MIKLANKIALASLLEPKEGMEKKAARIILPTGLGALAGGLVGNAQRNKDSDAMWPVYDYTQDLKPALGAMTGAATGLIGGDAVYLAGNKANDKLRDIASKIKNKKAKAILAALTTVLPTTGLVGGSAGAGALSGLGISKLIDL